MYCIVKHCPLPSYGHSLSCLPWESIWWTSPSHSWEATEINIQSLGSVKEGERGEGEGREERRGEGGEERGRAMWSTICIDFCRGE